MYFKLLGFSNTGSVRHFLFEREVNGEKTPFTVLADLAIARKFHLTIQDLPLLCSRLLQTDCEGKPGGSVGVTEAHMDAYSTEKQATDRKNTEKSAVRSRRGAMDATTGLSPVASEGSVDRSSKLLGGSAHNGAAV